METIKDLIDSIVGGIRDRLGNPLVGAYAIAWLLWNFRILLVLFGDGDKGWDEKLAYLDQRLLADWWTYPYYGMTVPLLIALFWVLVMPPVLRYFAIYHQKQLAKTRTGVVQAHDQAAMPGPEAAALRARMRKESERWREERSQLLKAIDELSAEKSATGGSPPASQPPSPTPSPSPAPSGTGGPSSETTGTPSTEPPAELDEIRPHSSDDPQDYDTARVAARALGLSLREEVDQTNLKRARVLFRGFAVEWPWDMSEGARESSSLDGYANQRTIFEETTLAVLFGIRDANSRVPNDHLQTALKSDRFSVQVAFDRLHSLGLLHATGIINSSGRLFVAWLIRHGFELVLPEVGLTVPAKGLRR